MVPAQELVGHPEHTFARSQCVRLKRRARGVYLRHDLLMAKSPAQIAADLDDLASEMEAAAAEYRRTAAGLRRRTFMSSSPEPEAPAVQSSRPAARPPGVNPSPGDTQRILLQAYRDRPGVPLTIDEVVERTVANGTPLSKSAAQGGNTRILKKGLIERVGHGRYRERAEQVESEPRPFVPSLIQPGEVHTVFHPPTGTEGANEN